MIGISLRIQLLTFVVCVPGSFEQSCDDFSVLLAASGTTAPLLGAVLFTSSVFFAVSVELKSMTTPEDYADKDTILVLVVVWFLFRSC